MDSCGWLHSKMLPARYPSAYLCSFPRRAGEPSCFSRRLPPPVPRPAHMRIPYQRALFDRWHLCRVRRDRVEELRWKSFLGIPVAFEIVNKPQSSNAVMGECRIHFHTSSSIQRPASSEQRTNARSSLQPRPAGFACVAIATHDFGARRVAKAELRILDALLGD